MSKKRNPIIRIFRTIAILFITMVCLIAFMIGYTIYRVATKPDDVYFERTGKLRTIYVDDDADYHVICDIKGRGKAYHDLRKNQCSVHYKSGLDTGYVVITYLKTKPAMVDDWHVHFQHISVFLPQDYEMDMIVDGLF